MEELSLSEVSEEQGTQLTPEKKQEVKLARRCFTAIDRLTSLMLSYPPGHPLVEENAKTLVGIFREFFELTDRLSVLVDSHSMKLLGTDEKVWETEEPRDYCWVLSRDGIYLIHLLAGLNDTEIRGFVDILNFLIDSRDLTRDAVSILFESNFRYISYDAIDESMAQLAGLEVDIRDRDTKEEREAIEELFENAFDKDNQKKMSPEEAARKHQEEFQLRMSKRQERQKKMQVGSRQFLTLSEEDQGHLKDLRRGFTEHAELEHREGEILAAILGARPKPKLREQSIEQIGEVMGTLLETQHPWESLEFLKLIHEWRENFDGATTDALKEVVAECFTHRRLGVMLKMVAGQDASVRRSILQMFNALHLNSASEELVRMLGWDVETEVRKDVLRYLKERSRYGVGFLREPILELETEKALPLVDIAVHRMPKSRDLLLDIITKPCEPELKTRAVQAMSGHWSAEEAEAILGPLLEASNEKLRVASLRGLADAAPDRVKNMLAPLFNNDLAKRPENEVREMASLYLQVGKKEALDQMRELIYKRGVIVSEADRELAVLMAKMIARSPTPGVVELLTEVGADWRVPGKIRSTCKELADLMRR